MNRGLRGVVLIAGGLLSGCGTALSCAPEIAAPPERAFWCAPASEFMDFFAVPPPPPPPPERQSVVCTPTLGEPMCVAG